MNVLIEFPAEQYGLFVAACGITSPEYRILKSNRVAGDADIGTPRTVRILCDNEEAVILLEAARQRYAEAVPAIRVALGLGPAL